MKPLIKPESIDLSGEIEVTYAAQDECSCKAPASYICNCAGNNNSKFYADDESDEILF